jgi:hypothetical protein
VSNVIKLPGRNSRKRKRFALKRAKERYCELASKLETQLQPDFSQIRTRSDLEALAVNDPFLYMKYMVSALT